MRVAREMSLRGHGANRQVIRNGYATGCGVIVTAISIALSACGGSGGGGTPSQSVLSSMLSEGTSPAFPMQELTLDEIGFDYGEAEAPIKVVEFSNFACGYCRRFHAETFPALFRDYIESGKVQWKYVSFVSGMFPNGRASALAGECAGEQGHFRSMSALLYERQSEWKSNPDPTGALEALAVEAGADARAYGECVAGDRPEERLRSGFLAGARLGVRGTPTFMVNGIPVVGAQPLTVWVEILTAIGGAAATDGDGSAPSREGIP